MTENPYERLDRLMNDRRLELDMSWTEVIERSGIKGPTLNALRKGTNVPTDKTKRGVERALEWRPGSIDKVLAGEGPDPVPPSIRVSGVEFEVPTPPGQDLARQPGESGFAYLDRIYELWKQQRDEGNPADRVRERVIRSALEDGERDAS